MDQRISLKVWMMFWMEKKKYDMLLLNMAFLIKRIIIPYGYYVTNLGHRQFIFSLHFYFVILMKIIITWTILSLLKMSFKNNKKVTAKRNNYQVSQENNFSNYA